MESDLDSMPCEILQEIVKYIHDQEDLLNLSSVSMSMKNKLKICKLGTVYISQAKYYRGLSPITKRNHELPSIHILVRRYLNIGCATFKRICRKCRKYYHNEQLCNLCNDCWNNSAGRLSGAVCIKGSCNGNRQSE